MEIHFAPGTSAHAGLPGNWTALTGPESPGVSAGPYIVSPASLLIVVVTALPRSVTVA